jgi:hypothetical protein
MSTIFETNREQYATDFRMHFDEKFSSTMAAGSDTFTLARTDIDEWLDISALTSMTNKPAKGDVEWDTWVKERNMIRKEMNQASSIGVHGEPPFRVDYVGGAYVVRFLSNMAIITATEAAAKLKSLANSKNKELERMSNFIHENVDLLPVEVKAEALLQSNQFKKAARMVAYVMQDYIDNTKETYAAVQQAMKAGALEDRSEQ